MLPSLVVRAYDKQQIVCSVESLLPVEVGRQEGAESLHSTVTRTDSVRLVVAPEKELSVSRHHALIKLIAPDRALVINLSKSLEIKSDGNVVPAGQQREFGVPALLSLGKVVVRLEAGKDAGPALNSLPEATRLPSRDQSFSSSATPRPVPIADAAQGAKLLAWLECVMDVLQVAATSESFFASAARALVNVAGLDGGRVIQRTPDGWNAVATFGFTQASPSHTVLEKVRSDRRTFWQLEEASDAKSLLDVSSIVAAPILNRDGEVIAVIYGDRRRGAKSQLAEFEARLVELLACGVAAGLARVEQEKVATAAVTRFEQFFTPALARRLASEPGLLKGRDCQVTVLFCDIRGFSRISEKLGAEATVAWVGDVMSRLSDCVLAQQGVLVDYVGDELMAMWGAPDVQPDQEIRACRAALDMQACLPELNERWSEKLRESFSFGIGINSGSAHVGNTGSTVKFKYGPLGNTVNLASRVQGATKHLKCRLLVTKATWEKLGVDFRSRRICQIRVVNIEAPVELYEIALSTVPDWDDLKAGYEAALSAFEAGDFRTAARTIGNLVSQHPDDGPSLLLLARAVKHLADGTTHPFDSVWTLTEK